MSRKQSPKNRIFLITLYISVIAVAAVLGVVIAFGAGVQRAHGDISVGYVADNVNCTAQAWYQVSGSNTKTYFTDGNDNSTLSFSASSQAQTKNFISGNVTLKSDQDYVMVTFMFRNNAPAGGDDIRLSLTDSSVKTNIATYYYVRTCTPSVTLSTNYNDAITGSTSVPGPVYIKPGNTIYYEIVIKIADLDYSASYSATSGHGILWLLENSEFSKSYQTVEYIEGTGTQWIDTGVGLNLNTDAFEVRAQATTANQNGMIIGQYFSNDYYWLYHFKNGGVLYLYYTNTAGTQGYFTTGLTNTNLNANTFEYANKSLRVNGVITSSKPTTTFCSPQYTCRLFTANGEHPSLNYYYQGKIFYCNLWKSGVVQRTFTPVKRLSDNAIGLWDSVYEVFYGNSGTGTFVAGPATADFASDFVQVDYIQSSGSQKISTVALGTATSDYVIEYDMQFTSTSGRTLSGFSGAAADYWGVKEGYYQVGGQTSGKAAGNRDNIVWHYHAGEINKLTVNNSVAVHLTGSNNLSNNFLYLFAINNAYAMSAKLYSCKITVNGVLVCDMIPARRSKDNKPGLYDKVTGTFYTNAGSGADFTLGPDAS